MTNFAKTTPFIYDRYKILHSDSDKMRIDYVHCMCCHICHRRHIIRQLSHTKEMITAKSQWKKPLSLENRENRKANISQKDRV